MRHKYGLIKSKVDHRDFKFIRSSNIQLPLPPIFDLRPVLPQVYDQGDIGSCTCNATAAAYEYQNDRQQEGDFMPSRLFLYANVRLLEGTPLAEDSGAQIRDVFKCLNIQGVCAETIWPYLDFTAIPSAEAYQEALLHEAIKYESISQDINDLKMAIMIGPVVIGISVYDSFESDEVASSGIIPIPNTGSENLLGGHAVCLCGWDDSKNCFILRNSWGTSWGINGYAYIPYDYILDDNLTSDLWLIQQVE